MIFLNSRQPVLFKSFNTFKKNESTKTAFELKPEKQKNVPVCNDFPQIFHNGIGYYAITIFYGDGFWIEHLKMAYKYLNYKHLTSRNDKLLHLTTCAPNILRLL